MSINTNKSVAVVSFLVGCATAFACDVPVFSYAIQFWEQDPYVVHVFYRGALSEEESRLVDVMNTASKNHKGPVNIDVRLVDLEEREEASLLELYDTHLQGVSPGLLVHYPLATRIPRPIHAGPLEEGVVKRLLDSPARRELAQRLLRGDMAVVLFLEGGNRRADSEAAQRTEEALARMAQVLQLPEEQLWVWSDAIDNEAGVRFSMMRVSRDDPEEEMLVRILLGSEPDLAEREETPMAFPIYGRGLSLYALVGAGINEYTIADACEFILGPCSCQVKASNPGTDLLMAVNWDQYVTEETYSEYPLAGGFSDFFDRGEEAAARLAALDAPAEDTPQPQPAPVVVESEPGHPFRWYAVMALGIVVVIGYSSYRFVGQKQKDR